MDGYLQATMATTSASPLTSRSFSTGTSTVSYTQHAAKLLPAYPPSNTDFHCTELNTPDGPYPLICETAAPDIHPHFYRGTHSVIVSMNKSSSSGTAFLSTNASLQVTSTKTSTKTSSTRSSSVSEQVLPVASTSTTADRQQQQDTDLTESSEDDGQSGIYFGRYQEQQSSALPIPIITSRRHQQQQQSSSSSRPIVTSSSSSSAERSIPFRATPITSSTSHTLSSSLSGQGYSGSVAPTLSTPYMNNGLPSPHHHHHDGPFSAASMSMTPLKEDNNNSNTNNTSTSIGGGSSVSSLSSLFSRNSLRNNNHPRKPKNSLAKTKSSFVLRIVIHDQLSTILASRSIDDAYLFFNVGMSFIWADANRKTEDFLSRISFTKAYPTCHDVNMLTRRSDHLDVIIGFSSGDCVWYDPITGKYFRLNKGGVMNNTMATCIKWIPDSEELFMVSFNDGSILILDKEREDQAFTPVSSSSSWADQQFQVYKPRKNAKYNPVSHWRVCSKTITHFAFSPDGSHLAIVSADGTLRIIDYLNERLCDVFGGYFGQLTCVDWSPDGKYILTGGQDDLVTLWSFHERRIVARCQGHSSWVTAVAFDPWRCDEHVYRFGSVGEDCKLILWDFSFSALHRPRHKMRYSLQSPPSSPKREKKVPENGKQRTFSFRRFRRQSSRTAGVFDDDDDVGLYTDDDTTHHVQLATLHPIMTKDQVPYLQPVVAQTVHPDPCSDLSFQPNCIVTTDRRGRVRSWKRP